MPDTGSQKQPGNFIALYDKQTREFIDFAYEVPEGIEWAGKRYSKDDFLILYDDPLLKASTPIEGWEETGNTNA